MLLHDVLQALIFFVKQIELADELQQLGGHLLLYLVGDILESAVDLIYQRGNPLTRKGAEVLLDGARFQIEFLREIVEFLLDAFNFLLHLGLEELLALIFIACFEECLPQTFHASGAEVWVVYLENRLVMLWARFRAALQELRVVSWLKSILF